MERYGQLINLSRSGQMAMFIALQDHLKRVEWNDSNFPCRLYPFIPSTVDPKIIVIDSRIAFGRPVTTRNNIPTATIKDRFDAGESPEELAEDYDIKSKDIQAAILCEHGAAAA